MGLMCLAGNGAGTCIPRSLAAACIQSSVMLGGAMFGAACVPRSVTLGGAMCAFLCAFAKLIFSPGLRPSWPFTLTVGSKPRTFGARPTRHLPK